MSSTSERHPPWGPYEPPADQWLRDLQDPQADEHHPGSATQERLRREHTHMQEMGPLVQVAEEMAAANRDTRAMMRRMMQLMFPPTVAAVYTVPASGYIERTLGDGVELFIIDRFTLMAASATMPSGVRITLGGMESEPLYLLAAAPTIELKQTNYREVRIRVDNLDAAQPANVLLSWRRLLRTEEA